MKKSLRQTALAYRSKLSAEQITAFGREITASLLTVLQTFKPCTVGLFYPTRGEPDLLKIMGDSRFSGHGWALPVCCESPTGPRLQFARYGPEGELEAGMYDIPVPVIKTWVQPAVLLVPCVAFHRKGARLGYGAGWYDRTLANLIPKPVCIGVAYSNTEVSTDFSESHDRLLDYVVTEKGVIDCQKGRSIADTVKN